MSPDDDADGAARELGTRTGGSSAVEGVVVPTGASVLPSDPKAIEDLIAQRRASLAATIDELTVRARPKEIARRSVADARGRLQAFATTPEGELRTERIAAVAAAAVAILGLLILVRRRRGRAR